MNEARARTTAMSTEHVEPLISRARSLGLSSHPMLRCDETAVMVATMAVSSQFFDETDR